MKSEREKINHEHDNDGTISDGDVLKIAHETGFCYDDVMTIYFNLIQNMEFPDVDDLRTACIKALHTGKLELDDD